MRRTRGEQLYGAIISPFFSGGVRVRLTSLFVNDAAQGSFMRSLLHIDADDFAFAKQPDGSYLANIDVLAVTFGDAGQVIDRVDRTDTVRLGADGYEKVLRSGFDYVVNVFIAKPGAYQLRMAVRDASTEKVGSASQFIEVPDLSGGRLALSGLVLSGEDSKGPAQAGATSVESKYDPQSSPAVRRLNRGAELFYNFAVYNARAEKGTAKPRLTFQARLFRDGREVYAGRQMPVAAGSQADAKQVMTGGRMSLGPKAALGEYVLQVIVTDAPEGERPRTASQWIDFEIVE